jgi:hypothetical protein
MSLSGGGVFFTTEMKLNCEMLWNGNECGKNQHNENVKATILSIDQNQVEIVEHFNYLGSVITYDARCTRGIKSRIATEKEENSFHQQIGLELKKGACQMLNPEEGQVWC